MKQVLWFICVPVVALVAGVAGSVPVLVMGLVVPMFIVGPLALITGSLLAVLWAGWVANFSAHGASARTRSRLWTIFAVALATSLIGPLAGMAWTFFVAEFGVGMRFGPSLAMIYLPGAVIFSGATTLATWRLRSPATDELGFLSRTAIVLAAVWMVFLVLMGSLSYVGSGYFPQNVANLIAGLEFVVLFAGGLILAALGIFLVTRFSRGARKDSLRWDAALSLVSVGLLPFAIAGTIFLGCSFSYCGA